MSRNTPGQTRQRQSRGTVDDVEAEAAALSARGVRFEHYDFPGSTRKGDVHIHGELKNAWFKDPDGNILSIVGR